MESLNKINQEKLEVIAKLDENGVAMLIERTVKKYYHAYVYGDELKFNKAWNSLKEIIEMFEDDYLTIYDFINYCMCKYSNLIVENAIKRDFELYNPFHVEFQNDMYANTLSASIKRSLDLRIDGVDKHNLRTLKEMCVAGETIDEDMVKLVDALCESFRVKKRQNFERQQEVLRQNGRLSVDGGADE
ncbi:hypothetical protein IKD48_03050 [bacterium]|nr:hypothetical protein [bacterium]